MTPEKSNLYMGRAQKLNEYMAWTGLSALSFCVLLFVAVSWLNAEFPQALPHAFNGKENVYEKDAPNYVRNAAELLNFATAAIAAVALPLVAIWAARLARLQANEASRARVETANARLSSIYMAIVERWHSDKILNSRKKSLELGDTYKNANSTGRNLKEPTGLHSRFP